MDFRDVVFQRESVRSYDPMKMVSNEVLMKILEAGRVAPSAANRQPWEFWLITSDEILKKVKESYLRPWFHDAPCVLAVVGKKSEAWVREYDSYNSIETDLTIVMDHIILAATNEGVGTCWIAAFNPAILRKALDLTDDQLVFAITPLGYPKAEYISPQRRPRKQADQIIRFL